MESRLGKIKLLEPEDWFDRDDGIRVETKDANRVWIPDHAPKGRAYLWSHLPIIADIALKECLKAIHKRKDAYHILLIQRLYSPLWLCMFYKLSDFFHQTHPWLTSLAFKYAQTLIHWYLSASCQDPALESMQNISAGGLGKEDSWNQGDGWNILCKLMQISKWLLAMLQDMACNLLWVPGDRKISYEDDQGCRGEPLVQAKQTWG